MTDEEIKKIAREYAEDYYAETPFGNMEAYQSAVSSLSEIVSSFLQCFSKDYCIVEKSKIAEMYAGFKLSVFRSYSEPATILVKACTVDVAKVNLLEYLFGKDMFEEGKL